MWAKVCAQMWACMLCHSEELCPPEKVDAGLNAVLQVAGGVMGRCCLGFWWADALLIGAYQVFQGKTPEAFVWPSVPWWRGGTLPLVRIRRQHESSFRNNHHRLDARKKKEACSSPGMFATVVPWFVCVIVRKLGTSVTPQVNLSHRFSNDEKQFYSWCRSDKESFFFIGYPVSGVSLLFDFLCLLSLLSSFVSFIIAFNRCLRFAVKSKQDIISFVSVISLHHRLHQPEGLWNLFIKPWKLPSSLSSWNHLWSTLNTCISKI